MSASVSSVREATEASSLSHIQCAAEDATSRAIAATKECGEPGLQTGAIAEEPEREGEDDGRGEDDERVANRGGAVQGALAAAVDEDLADVFELAGDLRGFGAGGEHLDAAAEEQPVGTIGEAVHAAEVALCGEGGEALELTHEFGAGVALTSSLLATASRRRMRATTSAARDDARQTAITLAGTRRVSSRGRSRARLITRCILSKIPLAGRCRGGSPTGYRSESSVTFRWFDAASIVGGGFRRSGKVRLISR